MRHHVDKNIDYSHFKEHIFLHGRLPDAGVSPFLDRGGSQRHHGVQPGPLQVPPEDPATAEEPGHGPVPPLLRLRPPPGQPLNAHP